MQRDRDGELHGESDSITEPDAYVCGSNGCPLTYRHIHPTELSDAKLSAIRGYLARYFPYDTPDEGALAIRDIIIEPESPAKRHAIPVCADPECRAEHICPDSSTDG